MTEPKYKGILADAYYEGWYNKKIGKSFFSFTIPDYISDKFKMKYIAVYTEGYENAGKEI